jgi:Holliday junction resolvase RusA-like endonuclease
VILLIQDFPSYKAGQNGRMMDWAKPEERARTRKLGRDTAENAPYQFGGERLVMRVSCIRPENRRNRRMDLCNVPGMVKGYLDGFTDAKLWNDDDQLVDIRFLWMTASQADTWLRIAGESDEGNGLLIFEIKREGELFDGENDGDVGSADADPASTRGGDPGGGAGGQGVPYDQVETVSFDDDLAGSDRGADA